MEKITFDNLSVQLSNNNAGFDIADIIEVTEKSPTIGKLLYKIDIDDFYDLYQVVTHLAIKSGNVVCLKGLYDARYSCDRGFPWYDYDLQFALQHAPMNTFLVVLEGWLFGYEERDVSLSYDKCIELAKENTKNSETIINILTHIYNNYKRYAFYSDNEPSIKADFLELTMELCEEYMRSLFEKYL